MAYTKAKRQPLWSDRALWGLLAVFLCLATTYSVVTPLFEASDELWHYPFVQHLAAGGALPVQDPAHPGPWLQEGSQPPLYYWLAALVSRWAPADDWAQLLPHNPHAEVGIVRPDGDINLVVHSPAEDFPYHGAALAIHLARGFSVLCSLFTVLFSYLLGREIVPQRPELALSGAAVAGLTPMFLFISGSVNNDNLLIALSTAALWLLVRSLRRQDARPRGVGLQRGELASYALLGALIGLAALTKVSALGLLPLAALVLGWVAWRRRNWQLFFWGGAAVLGAATLIAGWWYWRNWRLYGDPLGWNRFLAIAGPRSTQPSLKQLWSERTGFVESYWGLFGGVNVAMPRAVYTALNALALLAAGGLIVDLARRIAHRRLPGPTACASLALLVLWPAALFVGLLRWTSLTMASQGRLLFPAIGPLSLLLVLGLAAWFPRRWQTVPLAAASALLAGVALWAPFGVIAPAYAPPPLLTPAQQAAIPDRLDLTFGGQMDLLGYSLDQRTVQPGQTLTVTLYWRARAPMAENYSVFVHLLDSTHTLVAQRDVYPGHGLFPTRLWRPGDALADTYLLQVPADIYRPMHLTIEAGLYLYPSLQRLSCTDSQGQAQGDHVSLGDVLVLPQSCETIAHPVSYSLGEQIQLVGYDLDRTALRPGEKLHLTLFWKALAPVGKSYTVFTHVSGADGAIYAQQDNIPLGGDAPTNTWLAGEVICDVYELQVQPGAPPGHYPLQVGMYQRETLERLPAKGPEGLLRDSAIVLGTIEVKP